MQAIELLAGEPFPNETKKARQAFNDYARMGPGRSLAKLHQYYNETTTEKPPAKALRTLAGWSTGFAWQARVAAYDSEVERQKNAALARRRAKAMEKGLALDYKRVMKLKHLASKLAGEIFDDSGEFVEDAIWLPDVKSIGSGEFAERVDIVRFNRAILEEFRAILDDLAKETGGRKQRHDITTGDKPLGEVVSSALETAWKSPQPKS